MDLVVVEEQALSPRDSNCVMIQKPAMLPIRFIARTRSREVHFAGTNTTGDWRDENSQWRRAADVPH